MLDKLLEAAIDAALETGALIRESMGKDNNVEYKGSINPVTEIDKRSEEIIFRKLHGKFRDIGFLSEEGTKYKENAEMIWIVDPLDGTINFAHCNPYVDVSIGLMISGVMKIGVVYSPVFNELFYAIANEGAYLDKKRIKVSKVNSCIFALMSTGFPYDIAENPELPFTLFNNIVVKCQGIRRNGAAGLDLCYLACGRVDGFWEVGLKPWDTAAGMIIINEAGGTVTDFNGLPFRIESPYILASNGIIHNELLSVFSNINKVWSVNYERN